MVISRQLRMPGQNLAKRARPAGVAPAASGLPPELSNGNKADQPAANDEAAAPSGCGLAPLIRSHSMIASSPSIAGKALLKILASYCGNSKPVKLTAR